MKANQKACKDVFAQGPATSYRPNIHYGYVNLCNMLNLAIKELNNADATATEKQGSGIK